MDMMQTLRNDLLSTGKVYRDCANVSEDDVKQGPGDMEGTNSKKDKNFPVRLHYVLSEMEKDGLQHIVSWQSHGRCFIVHDQKLFAKSVLPL
jgi:hypothetical protein